MNTRDQKPSGPAGPAEESVTAKRQAETEKDGSCRCKEVSEMPPRRLFRLMLSDLAFWKRAKKA